MSYKISQYCVISMTVYSELLEGRSSQRLPNHRITKSVTVKKLNVPVHFKDYLSCTPPPRPLHAPNI